MTQAIATPTDQLWNLPEVWESAPAPLQANEGVQVYMRGAWVEGEIIHPNWRDHDANGVEHRGVLVRYTDGTFINRFGRRVMRWRKALVEPVRMMQKEAAFAAS